jgi:hypothetical protein
MTYGQGRLISNIGPGQSSALRPLSMQTIVTNNFKEYDLDTEYCFNIYTYFVCESRDMFDGSDAYIILLKLKTILFTWR